jgi:hypothetical protein
VFLTIYSINLYAGDWSLALAVVAKVNGKPVGKADIEKLAGYLAKDVKGKSETGGLTPAQKEGLAKEALRMYVRSQLIEQDCRECDIVVTDEEVSERIKELGMEDNLLRRLMVKNELQFDSLMRTIGKPLIEPSPKKVRKFYKENSSLFSTPRFIKARHITVPKATAATRELEKRKIERYLKEITLYGKSFEEVARKRSPSQIDRQNGGLLLPPGAKQNMGMFPIDNPVFEKIYPKKMLEALRKLKPKVVSDIVESDAGFHILYIEEEKPAVHVSFSKSQRHIIRHLLNINRIKRQRTWLEDVIKRSRITWHNDEPITIDELMPPKPKFELGQKR